ncbi:MAG: M1 family metallopeptidase [Flammeovirgaceae bacterium]|nr:MAG: M1 family metallopeptidase [Flammeovirgaceae bacterium]
MLYRILVLLSIVTGAVADNYPRNEAIDIKKYTFRIELNDTTNRIAGQATIMMAIKKIIRDVELDLVQQTQEKGMTVNEVRVGNRQAIFSHKNNRLKILLPTEAAAGSEITITIHYAGIPQDGLIISKNKFGDRTFFGDNWPDRARNWLPAIDHPYDKAKVEFIVIAPPHYDVVANGARVEQSFVNSKQKLTHWSEEADIPTKVMVIGVARFAIHQAGRVGNIPVESWVYPQNKEAGYSDYQPAVKVLDFFNRFIGPYPYEKLANVQSTTIYGGMENASNIFYYENSVTGNGEIENLIAHEIAHQWFGNSASENDWHHVWLSEGFATYFTHVYNEFTYGVDRLKEGLQRDRTTVIQHCTRAPAAVIDTRITDYPKLLSPHVYQRGSWVLHMLRQEMGDEAFFTGIRNYYTRYQNSNALTSDFRLVMEAASGKTLNTFFGQWLEETNLPELTGQWAYNPAAKAISLTIEQVQPGRVFDLNLEIAIHNGTSEPVIKTVKINQKSTKTSIPVDFKPVKLELDPATKLLFKGNIRN